MARFRRDQARRSYRSSRIRSGVANHMESNSSRVCGWRGAWPLCFGSSARSFLWRSFLWLLDLSCRSLIFKLGLAKTGFCSPNGRIAPKRCDALISELGGAPKQGKIEAARLTTGWLF